MTSQIQGTIEAVVAGSLDREIALYRFGTPGLAQHVMKMTDARLAEGVKLVAKNEMQQRCIDCAKIEIAYRAR